MLIYYTAHPQMSGSQLYSYYWALQAMLLLQLLSAALESSPADEQQGQHIKKTI